MGASIHLALLSGLLSSFLVQSISSPGCSTTSSLPVDELLRKTISIKDPRFTEDVVRSYLIRIPGGGRNDAVKEKKLMLYFHGLQGNGTDVATKYEYNMLGRDNNMITVFPEGMSDVTKDGVLQTAYQSWNAVGSSESDQDGCDDSVINCYDSCKKIHEGENDWKCPTCSFATCHNDTLFVSTLLQLLLDSHCIDKDHVFATGLSNGGLMTYEIISKMPEQFTAFAVVYGLPIKGFRDFSGAAMSRPLIHIHGDVDLWVPLDGSKNLFGTKFEPAEETVAEYAKTQGCSDTTVSWPTPYDSIRDLSCYQYESCDNSMVVFCGYSGHHIYPPMIEELTWIFFQQVSQSAAASQTLTKLLIPCVAALNIIVFS